jgi:hypothetical protein
VSDKKPIPHGKSAADSAAQHLANLTGRSVAGLTPKSQTGGVPTLDLSEELFRRRNVAVASLVILAALLHGNAEQQNGILQRVKPASLGEKSFDHFLFEKMADTLSAGKLLVAADMAASIEAYGPTVWGEPSNARSLQGARFTWKQVLELRPTPVQVERAIELREMWARAKELL